MQSVVDPVDRAREEADEAASKVAVDKAVQRWTLEAELDEKAALAARVRDNGLAT
jgi:hypothetical protein